MYAQPDRLSPFDVRTGFDLNHYSSRRRELPVDRQRKLLLGIALCAAMLCSASIPMTSLADDKPVAQEQKKDEKAVEPVPAPAPAPTADPGDTAWMLISSALVMFMMPGLALFYGGMVRRKNVLATMMQSMVALAVVGVYWIAVGYSLAFGQSYGGWIGWSPELLFLKGIETGQVLPGYKIPIYVHVMFQGMFAIITPALISGAIAERIRFGPYCAFILAWVTLIYCPLAHWVWAFDFFGPAVDAAKGNGASATGWLGKMGALDFAGGTVVHIAAGFSGLAAILLLRKRLGYPQHPMRPNAMVLTLTGAGLLWFGWFGFNGGSALGSNALAASAFSATQAAAAAAGLSWMVAEWIHKGKPTALGLASGIVAGLVAVTPASGFVYIWGGLAIGLIAGVVCYISVCLKAVFKYDDSLDAFGVHGVGGFLGAVLTGVFCYVTVNSVGFDGLLAGRPEQVTTQLIAAGVAAVFSFVGTIILVKLVDIVLGGFITDDASEIEGLDHTEHAETGFDMELEPGLATAQPRPAAVPPNGLSRFSVVVDGVSNGDLMTSWNELCKPGQGPAPEAFKSIYPFMTTVQGNRFNFRGGDREKIRKSVEDLFKDRLKTNIKAHVQG